MKMHFQLNDLQVSYMQFCQTVAELGHVVFNLGLSQPGEALTIDMLRKVKVLLNVLQLYVQQDPTCWWALAYLVRTSLDVIEPEQVENVMHSILSTK